MESQGSFCNHQLVMLYFAGHIYWVNTRHLLGSYFDFRGKYYEQAVKCICVVVAYGTD